MNPSPESGSQQQREKLRISPAHWVAIAVWTFGTLCLPIGVLFDGEITYLRYHLNLDQIMPSVDWPIAAISGPIAALIATFFLPFKWQSRLKLGLIPIAMLGFILMVHVFFGLFFSGWPTD